MNGWLRQDLPAGAEIFPLPALASRRGAHRLAVLTAVLGREQALAAAAKAGAYLLEDDLCRKLKLLGLVLPASGELRALSPAAWRPLTDPELPEGAEIRGLLLAQREQQALLAFLRKVRAEPASPAELVRWAEEYFFAEELKVIVRYTAPRFHHP